MEFPVISMKLLNEDNAGCPEMVHLAQACKELGYFQLIDHGIPTETIDAIAESIKSFFDLPLEIKTNETESPINTSKPSYENKFIIPHKLGYHKNAYPVFKLQNQFEDPQENIDPHDWVQRLTLPCFPIADRGTIGWPGKPGGVREKIEDYAMEMKRVAEKILRCLAVCVGLKRDAFVDGFGGRGRDESASMRMVGNYTPPVPAGVTALTAPKHRDVVGITLLLAVDGCQGFQVLRDGKWKAVPWMNTYSLGINIGDLMQVMSNGRYKSVVHRAVNLDRKMRVSIACPYSPSMSAKIGPVMELIDEQHPRLYGEVLRSEMLELAKAKQISCFDYFSSLVH